MSKYDVNLLNYQVHTPQLQSEARFWAMANMPYHYTIVTHNQIMYTCCSFSQSAQCEQVINGLAIG